jgi:putative transposase
MKIQRAHQIQMNPNNQQANYFVRACGIARFVYNWALSEWIHQYEAGDKPSVYGLKKKFNAIKREQYPWILEVTKCAPEQAFNNLGKAFKGFFRNLKAGRKSGYPCFKKRSKSKDSFYLSNDQFQLNGKSIKIPKLGWVKMREKLRLDGKIMSAVVSRTAGRWFVSIQVEIEAPEFQVGGSALGVDLGIKELATVSDGRVFGNPRPLKTKKRQLRLYQKAVSRKKRGSNNRKKAIHRLQRLHYQISCIRKDAQHKATTAITTGCRLLGIESLQVKGMLKNHKLARALSDASMGEVLRQLEYKADGKGITLVKADKFYPSSKTCSGCGSMKIDLALGDRVYRCKHCGLELDRDLNAALNLKNLAVGSTVSACRLGSSGARALAHA